MTRSKFIVVEHHANRARLHYDLRFKMPKSNNWASFAVRKGIPTSPGKKHLAVRTHDHSRAEALFIGTIEKGYGAGKLKKWDDGNCIIHKYSPSHIAIEFKGRKLKGIYHLVSTGVVDRNYKRQTYFLFKGKIIRESTGNLMGGMIGRVPPSDTEEVEIDNEIEDRNMQKPLPWSFRKAIMVIRTDEREYDEKQPVKYKKGGGLRGTVFHQKESQNGTLYRIKRRLHISEHNQLEASGMSSNQGKVRGR